MRISTFLLLALFSYSPAEDTIEEFIQNRFTLYPPTEQDESAVHQAINIFFEKLAARDIPGAYFLTTSLQFQKATSLEKFKIFAQSFQDVDFNEQFNKYTVSFIDVHKSKALCTALLKSKTGQNLKVDFTLENQDEEWKIMSVKVYKIGT